MMMSVSTLSRRARMPASAWLALRLPSKANGRVTTPTVRAPSSRASSAMTGAAPVPVPPPLPAVTNTMSAPLRASRSSSLLSIGGLIADGRVGARAQAARDLAADVDLHVGVAHLQRLRVGVDGDELHAAQPRVDHAVDGVGAAAAHADHLDDGEVVRRGVDHRTTLLWGLRLVAGTAGQTRRTRVKVGRHNGVHSLSFAVDARVFRSAEPSITA